MGSVPLGTEVENEMRTISNRWTLQWGRSLSEPKWHWRVRPWKGLRKLQWGRSLSEPK